MVTETPRKDENRSENYSPPMLVYKCLANKQKEQSSALWSPLQQQHLSKTRETVGQLAGLSPTMDTMGSPGKAGRLDQRPPEVPYHLHV